MQRPVRLLAIACFLPAALALLRVGDERTRVSLLISAAVSLLGYAATKALIPVIQRRTLAAGLSGRDLNKAGTEAGARPVPEALGLAPGVVFLVCIVLFQQLHYHDAAGLAHWAAAKSGLARWIYGGGAGGGALSGGVGAAAGTLFGLDLPGSNAAAAHSAAPSLREFLAASPRAGASDAWLVDYNAALASICFMLFLGFADDVLDVPWRVKLALPALASLPLLIAYSGGTGVVVPRPLRVLLPALPPRLELGALYTGYMAALVVFCANAVNILAGVNGLEAGQTLVAAAAVLAHNVWELGGPAGGEPAARDGHLFSAYLMLPLAATTLALLRANWFPARVFVGDTFTYFAGTALAVAGILGHFSETLLLFLAPQVFNFAYSLPQLLKLVPCPRHRLPRFDPATGLLHATPNYNLVNLVLRVGGPCSEERLCVRLLALQGASCAATFGARKLLSGIYK